MNRLFRISFDTFLTSITPIISWFLIGMIIDKNLINIFTLVYPVQAIMLTIKSIFGTGANISKVKDNNKSSVYSGFILGTFIGLVITLLLIVNIDSFITFMNMDTSTYRIFASYAIIQLFLQLILNLSLCKLYYEGKNKKANLYSILFNAINLVSLITTSIITKNQIIISCTALITTIIFVIFMLFKTIEVTRFNLNIKNCIKYNSVYLLDYINLFIIYLIGFKNSFSFGDTYVLAISFATLITDTQWDMADSVITVAQIDISNKNFSYKEHIKNSRKLVSILVLSSILMGCVLYGKYKTNIFITLLVAGLELIAIYLYPIYITKLTFIQLEHSQIKATINKQIANTLRIVSSFIPTPFCTAIGTFISMIYQLVSTNFIIKKNKLNLESLNKEVLIK